MPSKSVEIKCSQCGQVGTIRQRDIKRLRRPWLCAECRTLSENNPNWRGGISRDYYRYKRKSIARYPKRNQVRMQTRYHIKAGHLTKPAGTITHHFDYDHWSHVQFIKPEYHRAADEKRRRNEQSNAS